MTRSRCRTLSAWLVTVVCALSLLPMSLLAQGSTPQASPGSAEEPPTFLLEPVGQDGAYFTVTMEPGTSQDLMVALGNGGQTHVTALTYVSDAYTLVNGGFGVKAAEEPASGATTWIDYAAETLDLAPGTRVERSFTVTVPDDAEPGQYIAALSIQTAESIAVGGSDMLRQIIKKSVAIFVIVPGPEMAALEIGDARVVQTASSNTLVVEIRNPGNVYVNPLGTVEMAAADGKPVLTAPITMGPVYAGMETTLELGVSTMLAAGDYTVSVALGDEERGVEADPVTLDVRVAEPPASATPVAAPVSVSSAEVEPIRSGSGELQAVNVLVGIENAGAAIPNARLTLRVMRDGAMVEAYPLNSSLVVPQGATEIEQRYIPLESWAPGEYTFSLTLESVDPTTEQVTVVATQDVDDTITAP